MLANGFSIYNKHSEFDNSYLSVIIFNKMLVGKKGVCDYL